MRHFGFARACACAFRRCARVCSHWCLVVCSCECARKTPWRDTALLWRTATLSTLRSGASESRVVGMCRRTGYGKPLAHVVCVSHVTTLPRPACPCFGFAFSTVSCSDEDIVPWALRICLFASQLPATAAMETNRRTRMRMYLLHIGLHAPIHCLPYSPSLHHCNPNSPSRALTSIRTSHSNFGCVIGRARQQVPGTQPHRQRHRRTEEARSERRRGRRWARRE